jgi:hypothetical protein
MKKIRHGVGTYKHDGNEYEGEFADDKMHGHGEQGPFHAPMPARVYRGAQLLEGQTMLPSTVYPCILAAPLSRGFVALTSNLFVSPSPPQALAYISSHAASSREYHT